MSARPRRAGFRGVAAPSALVPAEAACMMERPASGPVARVGPREGPGPAREMGYWWG